MRAYSFTISAVQFLVPFDAISFSVLCEEVNQNPQLLKTVFLASAFPFPGSLLGLLSFLMLHKRCGIRVVLRTFADIHHQKKEERAICQFRTC